MFQYAKLLRKAPAQIAADIAAALQGDCTPGEVLEAQGPYVNIRLNRADVAASVLAPYSQGAAPVPQPLAGERIIVEFSSPNTNKPLHLGHLRNDALGESVSRILKAAGAEVRKVCIINDRGIHICKSMLAYQIEGGDSTPETTGEKGDHFVGRYYVRFAQMDAEDKLAVQENREQPWHAEERARDLLRKWESGDAATRELWQKMNSWTVGGMKQTYERTGVSFDQYYFESNTYLLGKKEILDGLERGVFFKADDGSVQVDLTADGLDNKVLLRSDGTSIYMTQDIGLAINRQKDWPFDRMVYVVGSEQNYHFQALFAILRRLGLPWADRLTHLSYGMVNIPGGRMKSREGTVVDADDLVTELQTLALQEIRAKEREDAVGSPTQVAENIALGALHYYLLKASPAKDMLFNPEESLSFNGDTGPYLQYMGARITALLNKAEETGFENIEPSSANCKLLVSDPEWDLVKTVAGYGQAVAHSAAQYDPSILAAYLYDLSRAFSRFYHDCPILSLEDKPLCRARLSLASAVRIILREALSLICVPFLNAM
jgi:arginyl-tRNA synthetase